MAKNSLERYTHYYERWASNQTVRNIIFWSFLGSYSVNAV